MNCPTTNKITYKLNLDAILEENYINMDSSTDTKRPLAHYQPHCILCVFLILLGIFGCGGDEMDISGDEGDEDEVDTSGDEVNPSATSRQLILWRLRKIQNSSDNGRRY